MFGLAQEQSRDSEVHVFDVPRIEGFNSFVHVGNLIVHRFCNKWKKDLSSFRKVNAIA